MRGLSFDEILGEGVEVRREHGGERSHAPDLIDAMSPTGLSLGGLHLCRARFRFTRS
jgi:hypothetical protein